RPDRGVRAGPAHVRAGRRRHPRLLPAATALMFVWKDALYVAGADLWLDPGKRKRRAFVSHAHGDHIGRHEEIVATRATAALMRARLGPLKILELEFGEWC